MRCKVILRKRLNAAIEAAVQASEASPYGVSRIAYDRVLMSEVKRTSFNITCENMELLREYGYIVQAFYYKSVKLPNTTDDYRSLCDYSYDFYAIPVDSVGKKRNVIYIVEGRVG